MEPVTVSQINRYLKLKMDHDPRLNEISVCGEISNFTRHKNGHLYFSLKDEQSTIRVVMFRQYAERVSAVLGNGQRTVVRGQISVYERDGVYQIYANALTPEGIGDLSLAFQRLADRLRQEGLFDAQHKKALPPYPEKIGILTSPVGAAVQDMIQIFARRFALCELVLYPAVVQGAEAPKSLIYGLRALDARGDLDIIIIGRGGGSAEDLWCFNDEALAREIYAAKTPVVSGVGHETDFTICDFVSDLRAPTPSAAAELCVPDARSVAYQIAQQQHRAEQILQGRLRAAEERLMLLSNRPCLKKADYFIGNLRQRLELLQNRPCLREPKGLLVPYAEALRQKMQRLQFAAERCFSAHEKRFSAACAKLDALSPLKVLSRGFGLVTRNGRAVTAKQLHPMDAVTIRFSDGSVDAQVTSKSEE